MRKILIIAFITMVMNAMGQKTIEVYSEKTSISLNEEISLHNQFLDSLFYQGKVFFKNGKLSSALMNYNLLDNGISFVDKDKNVLLLDGLDEISLVIYNKRTFIPYQGAFLEQLESYKGGTLLLLKRKTIVKSNEVTGAYGMNTQSSNSGKYTSLDGRSKEINLNKEIKVEVTLESEYFLKINEKITPISRIKVLNKLFPDKKDNLLSYISSNKLNINKLYDLKQIVRYCVEDIP